MPGKHFSVQRLQVITNSDPLILTQEDFTHLEECRVCFSKWKRQMKKVIATGEQEKRMNRTSRSKGLRSA
jgi:hypothetical protein